MGDGYVGHVEGRWCDSRLCARCYSAPDQPAIAALAKVTAERDWLLLAEQDAYERGYSDGCNSGFAEVTAELDRMQSERDGIVRLAKADWDSKVAALGAVTAERDAMATLCEDQRIRIYTLRELLREARPLIAERLGPMAFHLRIRIDAALKGDDDE